MIFNYINPIEMFHLRRCAKYFVRRIDTVKQWSDLRPILQPLELHMFLGMKVNEINMILEYMQSATKYYAEEYWDAITFEDADECAKLFVKRVLEHLEEMFLSYGYVLETQDDRAVSIAYTNKQQVEKEIYREYSDMSADRFDLLGDVDECKVYNLKRIRNKLKLKNK